eukprot:GFUD01004931.1.p1 GENE.GFUD01004931.1~~GFUD01004931.1.p1  ORF type:complete len:245 (+),score=48.80 GFUD01004931.1:259-993(+)
MWKITRFISSCLVLSQIFDMSSAKSRHRQMTLEVAAGYEDCFFLEEVKSGQTIDFEYQVTSSSSPTGQNDISVRIHTPAPSFNTVYENNMVTEGSFNGEATESGDYRICLDNKVSTWSDKTVWFEIQVEDPEDDYDDDYMDSEEWENIKKNNEDTESMFEMKIDEIKTSVHDVRINVGKMRHFQFMLGAQMSKDTHQVGSNLEKINFWSVVHLLIMCLVGFTQVFMVKQLFEDKSMVKNLIAST